jgi:predicted Zn-dependent peptidase
MRKIWIFMILAALGVPVFGQGNDIKFEEFTLDNGLHVILHQDRSVPIVAVSMLYNVGSKNENPERTGFAHFFEHLMFEGSKNIERGQFDKLITNAGGVNNANTWLDRTFYYELLPSNQLKLGLYLESERLMHAKVDSIGVETQREVVKEEKRYRVDNQPYGTMLEEIQKRAFTVHPYRWNTIGSMEHLEAASMDDFVNFYKTFYVPQNATLSIAGDLDIAQTKEWVKQYFADIPRGENEIPRPDVVEPEQKEEIRDVVYDNIQLPAVIQAYKVPEQGSKDYYALNMLTTLLSQGQSSRLYKRIVDNEQKALQVGAVPLTGEDPGLFITYGIANIGVDPQEVENLIDEEFEKVKNDLITEVEFQKIRNQMETDFISQNSTMAGIAESLANYHVYFGDANLINTEIQRYMDVSREDIQQIAKKYLKKENRVVLYYLPKSEQPEQQN